MIGRLLNSATIDLRFGLRTLCKDRIFTVTVVLSLALGIGANSALFSLVNSLLLRPLPVKEPDRLVELQTIGTQGSMSKAFPISSEAVRSLNGLTNIFADVINFNELDRPEITIDGAPEGSRVVEQVSGNFFTGLDVKALRANIGETNSV